MKNRRYNKGLVIIAVLWLVVLLTVISAAVGHNSRLDMKVCQLRLEQLRCKWAGRAGVETAIGLLNDDTKESDSVIDLWSDNATDCNDIALEQCRFTVRIVDAAGKLNVNNATKEQLMGLPYMTSEIADSIIDWRDTDDNTSSEGVEGGYYTNLTYGYQIRNGPFKTIRELLMVRGVTEELLYGEDTNLNGQLDYNEKDGDASPPNDDADSELDEGWIAWLTCYSYDKDTDSTGASRVNVNSANENQLETSLGIPRSQARWIVENRNNRTYETIGDLISSSSPKEPPQDSGGGSNSSQPLDLQTFYSIADKITTGSGSNQGKVNVNTAPVPVLTALLGGDADAERTALEIVSAREKSTAGMVSIAELMQTGSVSLDTFKKIANQITTRSNVYIVRCFTTAERGARDGAKFYSEAVVDRSSTPCKILYWYQGANN